MKTYKVVYRYSPYAAWMTLIEKSSKVAVKMAISTLKTTPELSVMTFRDDY